MNRSLLGAALVLIVLGNTQTQAVELLVSGDFEVPVGQPEINGWSLQEFVTPGAGGPISGTASLQTFDPQAGTNDLFLESFNGNGSLDPNQGNFDSDNLPGGDVDGADFLLWQRGGSPTGPLDADDLATWEGNYGRVGGQKINAILSQTVPAAPSETYTFSGYSRFEFNYPGGFDTLIAGPLSGQASPTTNTIKLEFLDSGGSVIGSATTLDVRGDRDTQIGCGGASGCVNDDNWYQHTLMDTAPAGTVSARVTADARDMVFHFDPDQGAFYDTFSLTGAGDPNTQLLSNAGLDEPPATALDFWDIFEIPTGCCNDDVLRSQTGETFANHTPGGERGVFLKAFFGAHPNWEADPVTGLMSQIAEAVAGGSYTFSGWAKFEGNYSGGVDTIDTETGINGPGDFAGLASPTETLIVVEFLDPNGVVLNPIIDFDPNGVVILDPNSPNIIDVRAERQAVCSGGNANDQTCGPASDGWTQHTLAGIIAPAGTAFARLTAGMTNGVYNIEPQQSAFFDDFSLDGPAPLSAVGAVPEPTTAAILMIGTLLVSLGGARRRRLA